MTGNLMTSTFKIYITLVNHFMSHDFHYTFPRLKQYLTSIFTTLHTCSVVILTRSNNLNIF